MQSHGTPASDPAPSADSLDGLSRVAVNGATLAYREHGTGEPVVFVHGTLSDIPHLGAAACGDWRGSPRPRLQPPLRPPE